jgi:hypothetical protein
MRVTRASSLPCVAFFVWLRRISSRIGNALEILCLVTMLWAFNISNTRFEGFMVIFLTNILQDLPCLFKNPRFINVVSKLFYHGAWCRRWPTLRMVKYSFEVLCLDSLNVNKRQKVFFLFHYHFHNWFFKRAIYSSIPLAWIERSF